MLNELLTLFAVLFLGVLIGRAKFRSFSLGVSGALFVGLLFGHFGFSVSHEFFDLSLLLFVTAVGLLASKDMGSVVMKHGSKIALLSVLITGSAAFIVSLFMRIFPQQRSLIEGIFTGALTSSPGLAASLEGASDPALVTIGHSVSYPVGVIAVIVMIQLIPTICRTDVEKVSVSQNKKEGREMFSLVQFSLAVVIGILIGMIPIPLGSLGSVTLGNAGGGLIGGLFVGYISKRMRGFEPSGRVLSPLREMMLAMYLSVVGLEAGAGFVETVSAHGPTLLLVSVVVVFVPMFLGLSVGRALWHLDIITLCGAICGGMTSTPGLGAAIDFYGTDDVGASYGAAYPFAIICMVVFAKLLAL
jgi:putative transport protein